MNKQVTIDGNTYEMHKIRWTNWIFVKSQKSGKTYSVAQIIDGEIIEIDNEPALSAVSNTELANAWLES